jgi:hypothetical protein
MSVELIMQIGRYILMFKKYYSLTIILNITLNRITTFVHKTPHMYQHCDYEEYKCSNYIDTK